MVNARWEKIETEQPSLMQNKSYVQSLLIGI